MPSLSLSQRLRAQMLSAGPLSFAEFMAAALYDSEGGYYARGGRVGRSGDFFTSVSVGSCFGELLARQIAEVWERLNRPAPFYLFEQGANDGALAADILSWLRAEKPDTFSVAKYAILEPLAALQERQQIRLAEFAGCLEWRHPETPCAPKPSDGVFLCNELLDAFPVHRIRHQAGTWHEVGVTWRDGAFAEVLSSQLSPGLVDKISRLLSSAAPYPNGFTTEICLAVEPWLKYAASHLRHGCLLIADYGLLRDDYYDHSRPDGTLRAYRNHRLSSAVLADPGDQDLTAHVDWTGVAEAGAASGCTFLGLVDQARFLTALAAEPLQAMERHGVPSLTLQKWLRQFQTLTHPGQMGAKFQFALLGKDFSPTPRLAGLQFASSLGQPLL